MDVRAALTAADGVPRVSVIVPAYNSAATLPATLRSVVAQTYTDWEAVVVDDHSEDDSATVAAAIDARIRVVRSPDNRGPAGARNLALEHARGELIALLDADDLWAPGYLTEQVAAHDTAAAAGRPVGLVACDAHVLHGERLLGRTYGELQGRPDRVTVESLLRANPVFVSALVPRAVIDAVGPFSTETHGSEDHDMWLRIVESGHQVIYNPQPLATYRLAEGSVSSDFGGMARTAQATYRLALARGGLNGRQRRIAAAELRLQAAVERYAEIRATPGAAARLRRAAAALPLFARVALERPGRWPRWARAARGRPISELERARKA